jgi:hypothetical protein
MRPFPPFGDHLNSMVLAGKPSLIAIVFMGNLSWKAAESFQEHFPCTMCLPPKTSPYRYRWPLYQCEVYLVDTGRSSNDFVRQCVACFFGHGARLIHYFSRSAMQTFRKETNHG